MPCDHFSNVHIIPSGFDRGINQPRSGDIKKYHPSGVNGQDFCKPHSGGKSIMGIEAKQKTTSW